MEHTKPSASPARSLNDHTESHDASSQDSTKVPPTGRNSNENGNFLMDDEKAGLQEEDVMDRGHERTPAVDDEKANGHHSPPEESAPSADKELPLSRDQSRTSKELAQEKKEAGETTTAVVEPPVEVDESATSYPSGTALTLLTVGLCLATFVVALDNTIIGKKNSLTEAVATKADTCSSNGNSKDHYGL